VLNIKEPSHCSRGLLNLTNINLYVIVIICVNIIESFTNMIE